MGNRVEQLFFGISQVGVYIMSDYLISSYLIADHGNDYDNELSGFDSSPFPYI